MTQPSDLDTLAPEPRLVPLRSGETVTLEPFKFGQWPRAIRLFRPITEAVQAAGIASLDGGGLRLAADWPMRLPQLLDEAGEALLEFLAFAIGKPRAFFDVLGGDDGVALTRAVFEVQGDFFVARIAPMLGLAPVQQAAQAPAQQTEQGGAPSSPDSSATATAGATSTA